ncbi:helix-turn-helix transcriptional regulator [Bacillus sp. HSf4]|uniref:helix-turn-helix domain-containing protein n=1 Tax=Bacillus sp. HSf4 TaxID=3035514 RepID=UPI002409AD3D|nr:helix-turn-helix transcriptional regulator [Bacillus sp. HSf4]WFA05273.1 helix-turn-helix transcriptional regulator [Bacillus sp. HSf4]
MKMGKGRKQMNDDFAKLLKNLRISKGYSLKQLAERSNVTPSYLNRLERGERKRPTFSVLEHIAEGLDVDVNVLLGLDAKDTNEPLSLEEMFFTNEIEFEGKLLSADQKEVLLDILQEVLEADATSVEQLLDALKRIGELIVELQES